MKNIIFIAAHPDDETLGCGGTILKHKKNILWHCGSGYGRSGTMMIAYIFFNIIQQIEELYTNLFYRFF